jgi:hypothetical protein
LNKNVDEEMKRDITIPVSAVLLITAIAVLSVYESTAEMPLSGQITKEMPGWQLVTFGMLFVSMLRLIILWWQTLFDAIRPKDQSESRSGWIILHFVLGFFTPYLYYYHHQARIRKPVS